MFLIGCSQSDSIKLAESAMLNGNPDEAACHYKAEIDRYHQNGRELDPRLVLNCGLAHFEANQLEQSEQLLQQVLDLSDEPDIQSVALNSLGNLNYRHANRALDRQNVSEAREFWEKAIKYYENASQLDGNEKAKVNLESLQNQITQRIEKLVTLLSGKVWRDINGDGIPQDDEPAIEAKVFWDKDNNGEFNATIEPAVLTNENGVFGFEWISDTYPSNLQIASVPLDRNQSDGSVLLPLFPHPPPPQNPDQVRNFFVSINEPGKLIIALPYRSAPQIRGRIWSDQDGDGLEAPEEKGSSAATLFLDTNGNFQLDENETSFKPAEDGKFSQIAPPASTRYAFNRTTRRQMLPSPSGSTKPTWPGSILSRLPTHLFSDFRIVTPMQTQIRKASNQMKPANRIHNHRMSQANQSKMRNHRSARKK